MDFMKDSISIENNWELHPSGGNEGPMVVIVDETFKLYSCDDSEEFEDQVGDHLVTIEETITRYAENDRHVERICEDGSCSNREWYAPREWWKNHILFQHCEQ